MALTVGERQDPRGGARDPASRAKTFNPAPSEPLLTKNWVGVKAGDPAGASVSPLGIGEVWGCWRRVLAAAISHPV